MSQIKLKIINKEGLELGAHLRLPVGGKPKTLAIFAHCFTCNKNLQAVGNISRALTKSNIGVLSFDFTGLGESDGDFSETNFSSNVTDIVAVSEFLKEEYWVPQILIGHSLGGAAVIHAAAKLPEVKAVITIGAPADVPHVARLFKQELEEIRASGQATVDIGGRPFKIKKQFLDDLEENPLSKILNNFEKPLLILHSPQDTIVNIQNAAAIYTQAKHPKSFITLDGADHLLSKRIDSQYVGEIIAPWASRYLELSEQSKAKSENQVLARTGDEFLTEILAGEHSLLSDEPASVGGTDLGPTPYDLLLSSLGACTGMTLRMYADRKKWPLQEVLVHLQHEKRHASDCEECESPASKLDHIDKEIQLIGDLDDAQRARLLEISARCPVHRTLSSEIVINSKLV